MSRRATHLSGAYFMWMCKKVLVEVNRTRLSAEQDIADTLVLKNYKARKTEHKKGHHKVPSRQPQPAAHDGRLQTGGETFRTFVLQEQGAD